MRSSDNDGSVVVRTNTEVTEIRRNSITTSKGEKVSGQLLDCRGSGPSSALPYSLCGYQKFWGFEITLQSDWPFDGPIVMDDRVDQADGFRFIYSLPFERRRVLVEDTRFSNESAIDRDECLVQVRIYLAAIGVEDWLIVREEHGILPMPISPELYPGRTGNPKPEKTCKHSVEAMQVAGFTRLPATLFRLRSPSRKPSQARHLNQPSRKLRSSPTCIDRVLDLGDS